MSENKNGNNELTKGEKRRMKFMELQNKIHILNKDSRKRKLKIINNVVKKALKEISYTSDIDKEQSTTNKSIKQNDIDVLLLLSNTK